MTQTPQKLTTNPNIDNRASRSPLNKVIITIQSGKIAPIIAPNPLLMYFTPQVLSPLLNTKLRMLRINMAFHCLPFGQGVFLYKKKATYSIPPMSCLIPANCKAGICFTPSFEASQVVPQKKLTQHKAIIGKPMVFILEERAFFILVFTLNMEL